MSKDCMWYNSATADKLVADYMRKTSGNVTVTLTRGAQTSGKHVPEMYTP